VFFCSNIKEGGAEVIKVGLGIEEQEAGKGKRKKLL
jgi:hypothetical protein